MTFFTTGSRRCLRQAMRLAGATLLLAVGGVVAQTTTAPARPVPPPAAASQPASPDRGALTAGLRSVVREVIERGRAGIDRARLVERLTRVMADAHLGTDATRASVAGRLADGLPLPDKGRVGGLTERDERRAVIIADTLATEVLDEFARPTATARAGSRPAAAATAASQPAPHTGVLRSVEPPPAPAGHTALAWKTLGGFPWVAGTPLPEAVRQLDKSRVALAGYMIAGEAPDRMREFTVVESLWTCCSGTPPAENQVVLVFMPAGTRMAWVDAAVQIIGTLEVGEQSEGGIVTSVYRIRATAVNPIR